MSGRSLRVLILEDHPDDAELAVQQLRRAGFDPAWRRVDDAAGFQAGLDPELDVILADYHQPQFDAVRALKLMQDAGLEIPFIIVSGAVGDDLAVKAVRQGALDYVLKDRLGRLGTAVENALAQSQLRRRHRLAQAALEHQALYDSLTDLPNRTLLRSDLDRCIGEGEAHSLLLLDIDNFKDVNDSFGHHTGDLLLRQIGPRLGERLEPGCLVARLGGDEFAILLPRTTSELASRVAHGLLRSLERPFLSGEHPLEITASIGIATYPEHAREAEGLLQRADVAMYAAKRSGGTWAIYRPEDDPYDARRIALRADLGRAIDRREILLYYQPQVALATSEVVGLEALARWQHATRGWIPPAEFIPVAERMGLIKLLTDYIVKTVADQLLAWQNAGIDIPVAINVSMRNLLDSLFPDMVEGTVAGTAIDPNRIKLEITESAVMAEPARVLQTMHRLRSAGIRFSIDDFGTGYSSLSYLQRLPVEEIKIDRSFVGQLTTHEGSAAIVRATIELGINLGLDVVAEGVEDAATWALLNRIGCSTAQGYFMSRPLPSGEVKAWLSEWKAKSVRLQAA